MKKYLSFSQDNKTVFVSIEKIIYLCIENRANDFFVLIECGNQTVRFTASQETVDTIKRDLMI